ncbi:hypothetical protein E7744_08695 [Citricoccus sp. SGAir0253]|uniref:hypothetical protein n=1 Tax=Citricoccus sp. SGAir0253 TaxID=2567881 RepID=UPI0010CCBEBD|nr:hypothetical protein [Citricoccus sp. SGAir0253]QCU78241.1 hypothetical protein E7744_08695 [Citricoccus sp. SGAir0253]
MIHHAWPARAYAHPWGWEVVLPGREASVRDGAGSPRRQTAPGPGPDPREAPATSDGPRVRKVLPHDEVSLRGGPRLPPIEPAVDPGP